MSEYGCKAKTIKKILNSKINYWLASITDKELVKLLKRDVIVTGGSITSMLLGEEIKDFDVYFKTQETTIAVAEYYCNVFNAENPEHHICPTVTVSDEGRVQIFVGAVGVAESKDAKDSEEAEIERALQEGGLDSIDIVHVNPKDETKPKYRPVFLSENAITLSDSVQLIIRFYGSPDQIHKNYDYAHTKNVWDFETNTLTLNSLALECILSKTLIYTGSLYPICSLFRMRKFMDRGWRISAGEILKMSWQISELNLNDIDVIKEQLTGCDMLYMVNLINHLTVPSVLDHDDNFSINSNYIIKIIDKVFNT